MSNTVKLHRVLRASPEKVYKAFTTADALAFWLPPYGFLAKVNKMDATVGGTSNISFINFTTSNAHSFTTKYVELKPGELIKFTNKFDHPGMPGEMQVTVLLKKVMCGTELSIVQENLPKEIPVEMCYLGWQESLTKLAHLVEPEIQD